MQNSTANSFQEDPCIGKKLTPQRAIRKTLVDGLRINCMIGIFPEEHVSPQPIEVNVELTVKENRAVYTGLDNVIRYDKIVEEIEKIASFGHIDLVETLAEQLVEYCECFEGILSIRVGVRKLNAIKNANSVGVELHRVYDDICQKEQR